MGRFLIIYFFLESFYWHSWKIINGIIIFELLKCNYGLKWIILSRRIHFNNNLFIVEWVVLCFKFIVRWVSSRIIILGKFIWLFISIRPFSIDPDTSLQKYLTDFISTSQNLSSQFSFQQLILTIFPVNHFIINIHTQQFIHTI